MRRTALPMRPAQSLLYTAGHEILLLPGQEKPPAEGPEGGAPRTGFRLGRSFLRMVTCVRGQDIFTPLRTKLLPDGSGAERGSTSPANRFPSPGLRESPPPPPATNLPAPQPLPPYRGAWGSPLLADTAGVRAVARGPWPAQTTRLPQTCSSLALGPVVTPLDLKTPAPRAVHGPRPSPEFRGCRRGRKLGASWGVDSPQGVDVPQ